VGKRMKIKQRVVSFFVISLFAFSIVSVAPIRFYSVKAQPPNASLIGVISDEGVDPNCHGLYGYLNVTVGVDVYEAGYFTVEAYWLEDAENNSLSFYALTSGYLNVGSAQLNLSFYGPTINHARFNPDSISGLYLSGNDTFDEISYARLSRTYNYSEFDPVAMLTGKIYDKGVSTNGVGLFSYLRITVEVNVTDPEAYAVDIELFNSFTAGFLGNSSTMNLSPGLQNVTVTFNGAIIRYYRMNFSTVYSISLQEAINKSTDGIFISTFQSLGSLYDAPLSTTYSYTEFQAIAYFTGMVIDKGVSNPGDSKFDYLEIDVQINVTEAGNYSIPIQDLYGGVVNSSFGIINWSDFKTGYFSVGLHFVNFTCPSQLIYASKVDPTEVGNVLLWAYIAEGWWTVDQLNNAPLPVVYNYTEFNPHAYLTGRVYDYGVDTDHDGLFDYLQTDIQVNVTVAGTYQLSVQGLAGNDSNIQLSNQTIQIINYQISNPLSLPQGIHLFNFTFYGPEIAYYGVNPRSVTDVSLYELSNSSFSGQVDYMQSIPLLTPYNSNEFDHPSNDMQLNFTVNPDGSVGINVLLNATHMYPQNPYYLGVNASAHLSKMDNLTLGSVNGTVEFPPYVTVPWPYPYNQAQFPTNQTTADYQSQYNQGILTEKLNATSVFPPIIKTQYPYNATDFTLLDTYSNGMMHAQLSGSSTIPQDIASEPPFNLTDLTIEANMGSNNEFTGNITLPIISGLPASSITVNFEGNRSNILFTGYVNVLYGNYAGIMVNSTTVAQLISEIKSNVTGEGPSSLYNVTDGILELTSVEVTNTTIFDGVRIDYNASVHGDFAALIATYITALYVQYPYPSQSQYYPAIYAALNSTLSSVNDMSFVLAYSHVQKQVQMEISFDSNIKTLWSNAIRLIPPTMPSGTIQNETNEINAMLEIGNATAYAVQNASLNVTYTGAIPQPKLTLSASFIENATQLNNDTERLIPDLLSYEYSTSPQMRNIIEAYINETYAALESCNTTVHLKNSIANFKADFAFEGSLDEQLDAAKSYYINLINYDYSLINATPPAQLSLLNQTSIDINNLGIYLQYGKNSAFLNVTGIVLSPPIQAIDSRAFKLTNFLNATSLLGPSEPPTEFEKLEIIIHGGSNATCVIIPSRSGTVPVPNEVSPDGRTFIWENTTISSLRDMIFNIAYQGTYQSGGTTYSVPILSNSTVSNFNFDPKSLTISFNVNGTAGTTGYCNMTIPRSLLDNSTQGQWIIEEDGNPIPAGQYKINQNANFTFIYITYTHSSHKISILGSVSSVQEMPPNAMPLVILILGLIATILIITQRKRIRTLKTRSLDSANRMLNRFSRNC
jgi:hypothetical protein